MLKVIFEGNSFRLGIVNMIGSLVVLLSLLLMGLIVILFWYLFGGVFFGIEIVS